nr:pilus assembly protein TadG-related protein [Massilia oculi]
MFVPLLVLLVAFAGLAMDMGMVYNRKVELSGMAKAAALAAAKELNGKSSGIAAARTRAREAAQRFTYRYGSTVEWNDAALSFGTTPARGGAWTGADGVGDGAAYFYAKVDSAALDAVDAAISTIFMRIFSRSLATIDVADVAIAGRAGIQAVPLAVCAMSETAASERANTGLSNTELIEYGFRRGVSYDLTKLNPRGTTAARYAINPVVPPGMPSTSFNRAILGPSCAPPISGCRASRAARSGSRRWRRRSPSPGWSPSSIRASTTSATTCASPPARRPTTIFAPTPTRRRAAPRGCRPPPGFPPP